MTNTWRYIDSGPCSASFNMALDEAVATFVRQGKQPPTLRLYAWDRPSVSIGCFQKTSDINVAYCESHDIPVVRRPTGGRAILHDRELTYSLSAPAGKEPFSGGLLDSYDKISAAFVRAFRQLGLYVSARTERERGVVLSRSSHCFHSSSFREILIGGRKLVGSAQKRWKDGFLQQGSIPFSYDAENLRSVFGDDSIGLLMACLTGLRDVWPEMNQERLQEALVSSFGEAFGVSLVLDHPSAAELGLALDLQERKYLKPGWNLRQSLPARAAVSPRESNN